MGLPSHAFFISNRALQNENPAMAAVGKQLSDLDLAAVITYERNSWGNTASVVQPADVAAAR